MPSLTDRVRSLSDRVELAVPAGPEMLGIIRMTAAAVASRVEFGYDQVEELRLALNELCLTLLEENPTRGRLELEFSWSHDTIEVAAAVMTNTRGCVRRLAKSSDPSGSGTVPNDFSARIIDAIADEHGISGHNGTKRSWLRMFRRGRTLDAN
ncbi:MAG: hypothetical protein ACRD6W_15340 [Nitrososphaerales archaeon]